MRTARFLAECKHTADHERRAERPARQAAALPLGKEIEREQGEPGGRVPTRKALGPREEVGPIPEQVHVGPEATELRQRPRAVHVGHLLEQPDRTDPQGYVGIGVTWIDNQSGCKGVCAGLPQERIPGDADPAFCDGERCLDGIMLARLTATVAASPGDLVVVLHMLGNHGPAYSRRYPPEFRKFVPTCESLDLSECSQEEIVNAYDNAIFYTDHVLASLIHYLESQSGRNTGLIYVSDHGESLGESGFYLHGLPYRIAPAVQREVPMLIWLSDSLQRNAGINTACLRQGVSSEVSHDHLFHSVLGLLQVETVGREPTLDVFTPCRVPAVTLATDQEPRGPATT